MRPATGSARPGGPAPSVFYLPGSEIVQVAKPLSDPADFVGGSLSGLPRPSRRQGLGASTPFFAPRSGRARARLLPNSLFVAGDVGAPPLPRRCLAFHVRRARESPREYCSDARVQVARVRASGVIDGSLDPVFEMTASGKLREAGSLGAREWRPRWGGLKCTEKNFVSI